MNVVVCFFDAANIGKYTAGKRLPGNFIET